MNEVIDIRAKRLAIVLSESTGFDQAANALGTSVADLREQVKDLEGRLCVHIFEPGGSTPELTREGRFLIGEFRKAVALVEGQ